MRHFETHKPARVTEPRAYEVVQAESGAAILDNVQAAVSFRHVAKREQSMRAAAGAVELKTLDRVTGILPPRVESVPLYHYVPRSLRRRNK
jgi:hypothetical protein